MEDLEKKLASGNSLLVAQIISKLLINIKVKTKNGDFLNSLPEFKFLKEHCVHPDVLISKTACSGLLKLAENNIVELQSTIADIVTLLPTVKCLSGVVNLLNQLIILDLQIKITHDKNYVPNYNLRLPQHPLVTLLSENSSSWIFVYEEIKQTYRQEENILLYNKLYQPVFLYTLCNPSEMNFTLFIHQIWNLLLQKLNYDKKYIIREYFLWMQTQGCEYVHINGRLLCELIEFVINTNQDYDIDICIYTLWATSLLYEIIISNEDPRDIIYYIQNIVNKYYDNLQCLNIVLIILSKVIIICPSVYLHELFILCNIVVRNERINTFIGLIIKPSLLYWIANPSYLTCDASKLAYKILLYLESLKSLTQVNENNKLYEDPLLKQVLSVNMEIYNSTKLCILVEKCSNSKDLLNILEKLNNLSMHFVKDFLQFLYLVFIEDLNDETLSLRSFRMMLNYATHNRSIASHVLTLILYKLSNIKSSDLHFELLTALPKMAIQKENANKIIRTITALTKGPDNLKILSMRLMYDLWNVDNKYYSHLENLLISVTSITKNKWEYYVTKAHILKELCIKRPELYGKDMVAHLSKLLNECNNVDGEIPCAIAIEGITILCKENIIDIVTTWATLSPEFKNDTRVAVIKSLCALISEIPKLTYTDDYPELVENVVATLWEFVTSNSEPIVVDSALKALNCFSLEQICSKFPFREEIFDKETNTDETEIKLLPEHAWIILLKNLSHILPLVADFLIRMISQEVSNYLKFVYQLEQQREPTDFSILPIHSCLRAVGHYLKKEAVNWKFCIHKNIFIECLRVLSHKYSKPLPPYNWCFLQELIHEPTTKDYAIAIASHQVTLSGTARRLMENYISALTETYQENNHDILTIYKNLNYLANSIQPVIFLPFFQNTIDYSVTLYRMNSTNLLLEIGKCIKEVLKNNDVQDINKNVVITVLTEHIKKLNTSDKIFHILLEIIVDLPLPNLTKLEFYKVQTDLSPECFKKVTEIRCAVAKNKVLTCLNDIIESSISSKEQISDVMLGFIKVFATHRNNTESALWILDLIGQIEVTIIDKNDIPHILYICNIFFLAITVFSGHFIYFNEECSSIIEDVHELFPQAMHSLMQINHWSICTTQALEWFYHMNMNNSIPATYRNIFGAAVQALRHEDEFKKNMKWMKYLNCNVNILL